MNEEGAFSEGQKIGEKNKSAVGSLDITGRFGDGRTGKPRSDDCLHGPSARRALGMPVNPGQPKHFAHQDP